MPENPSHQSTCKLPLLRFWHPLEIESHAMCQHGELEIGGHESDVRQCRLRANGQ